MSGCTFQHHCGPVWRSLLCLQITQQDAGSGVRGPRGRLGSGSRSRPRPPNGTAQQPRLEWKHPDRSLLCRSGEDTSGRVICKVPHRERPRSAEGTFEAVGRCWWLLVSPRGGALSPSPQTSLLRPLSSAKTRLFLYICVPHIPDPCFTRGFSPHQAGLACGAVSLQEAQVQPFRVQVNEEEKGNCFLELWARWMRLAASRPWKYEN